MSSNPDDSSPPVKDVDVVDFAREEDIDCYLHKVSKFSSSDTLHLPQGDGTADDPDSLCNHFSGDFAPKDPKAYPRGHRTVCEFCLHIYRQKS